MMEYNAFNFSGYIGKLSDVNPKSSDILYNIDKECMIAYGEESGYIGDNCLFVFVDRKKYLPLCRYSETDVIVSITKHGGDGYMINIVKE